MHQKSTDTVDRVRCALQAPHALRSLQLRLGMRAQCSAKCSVNSNRGCHKPNEIETHSAGIATATSLYAYLDCRTATLSRVPVPAILSLSPTLFIDGINFLLHSIWALWNCGALLPCRIRSAVDSLGGSPSQKHSRTQT